MANKSLIGKTLSKMVSKSKPVNSITVSQSETETAVPIEMINLVQSSGLFDTSYYMEQYPEVKNKGVNPILHYLEEGAKQGKNPSENFNTNFYLETYPDVAQADINPLVHYILHGQYEGRITHHNVEENLSNEYVENLQVDSDIESSGISPDYKENPDLASVSNNGIYDGSKEDFLEEIKVIEDSGLFDKDFYLKTYPDVKEAGIDPVLHYLEYGVEEGRNPSDEFDTTFYLEAYRDVKESEINPLVHYILFGFEEGRFPNLKSLMIDCGINDDSLSSQVNEVFRLIKASEFFDVTHYLSYFDNPSELRLNPIFHYLTKGINLGWKPSLVFSLFDDSDKKKFEEKLLKLKSYLLSDDGCELGEDKHAFNSVILDRNLSDEYENLKFSIDVNKDGVVSGWIFNKQNESETIYLEIFNSDTQVATIAATSLREDLNVFGIENLKHGFHVNINLIVDSDFFVFRIREKKSKKIIVEPTLVFSKYNQISQLRSLQNFFRNLPRNKESLNTVLINQVILPKMIELIRNDQINYEVSKVNNCFLLKKCNLEIVEQARYSVDVVIPVYRGLEETKQCILSVLEAKNNINFNLIVINDFSPDDSMNDMLESLNEKYNFILLNNIENLGFVKTVNIGMKYSDNDVVLLNSDTIVIDNWLDALYGVAYQSRDCQSIATVTPLSNNATICSYPKFCQENALPTEFSLKKIQVATSQSLMSEVDLPTAHGFCMFIKRTAINEVGYFDEESWNMGYGEENDFSIKLLDRGLRNVATNKTFIVHEGSVSFDTDKKQYVEENSIKLRTIYPEYPHSVSKFIKDDPMRPLRNELSRNLLLNKFGKAASNTPTILLVSMRLGGGVEKAVNKLAHMMNMEDISCLILTSTNEKHWRISNYNNEIFVDYDYSNEFDLVVNFLKSFNIIHIDYHHVIQFNEEVWRLPELLDIHYDVTLHDYYMICPRANFLTVDDKYCGIPATDFCNKQCLPIVGSHEASKLSINDFDNDVREWRAYFESKLNNARRVVVPNGDVAVKFQEKINIKNIVVKEHPEDSKVVFAKIKDYDEVLNSLHIGFIGAIGEHKGLSIIKELASYVKESSLDIMVTIIGYTSDDTYFENFEFVHITGKYDETNLETLLNTYQPDLFFLSSIIPETYSYTYSELKKHGQAIIAYDIGAISVRGYNDPLTCLIPIELQIPEIIDRAVDFMGEISGHTFNYSVGNEYCSLINDYYNFNF